MPSDLRLLPRAPLDHHAICVHMHGFSVRKGVQEWGSEGLNGLINFEETYRMGIETRKGTGEKRKENLRMN